MSDIIVRTSTGGLSINNGPSVLGEQSVRIPVGGKVKGGIKVLTPTAKQHPKAQGIYEAGVKGGHRWGTIEKALIENCGFTKSPLTPKNVPYFSVFNGDFTDPKNANLIMEKYGQDVDGVRRLMRFPVIFPTDSWQANLPHGFHCYKSSQLEYWSEYDKAGNRVCFTRKPVEQDAKNRRAKRNFGGRASIPRPDTNGVCDPEECPQYQSNACNLSGRLLFFIPGIPGSGAIELPLKSFYGMDKARQAMAMVAYLRGGRISGLHDDKAIFYVTKKHREVPMLDRETGAPKRVWQYIIELEADVDMLSIFQNAEQRLALAASGAAAAATALNAPEPHIVAGDFEEDEYEDDDDGPIEGEVMPTQVDPLLQVKALRRQVSDLLVALDIVPDLFGKWMVKVTMNADWSGTVDGLNDAMRRLNEAQQQDVKQWKAERGLDLAF